MVIKNFVFRENWIASKVAGMKTTFFAIFDPTWRTYSLAPKEFLKGIPQRYKRIPQRNSLEKH